MALGGRRYALAEGHPFRSPASENTNLRYLPTRGARLPESTPAMTQIKTLVTPTDIAKELGVTNASVSAWVRERNDTPPAKYRVSTGFGWRYFWEDSDIEKWKSWLTARKATDRYWRENR